MSWKIGDLIISHEYSGTSIENLVIGTIFQITRESLWFNVIFAIGDEDQMREWHDGAQLYTRSKTKEFRPSAMPSKQQRRITRMVFEGRIE
jgi:hypothetical protein